MERCPRCGTEKVEILHVDGGKAILCKECGYDEMAELDVVPEERSTQREKGKYSPYKTGGYKRAR